MSVTTSRRGADIVDLLERSESVVMVAEGSERSTKAISEAGRRLACDFAAEGLRPGDRIAVQLTNGDTYLDLLAAAAHGGFVLMSVNTRFGAELSTSLVERSGSVRLMTGPRDLPARTHEAPPLRPGTLDDRYVIFTTSGTTSAPKLVVHRQRSIVEHAADVADAFGYGPDSVVMVPLPLCGVFGFTVFWAAIAGGSRVVLPDRFDADDTARLIQRERVTSLHGSDDMFHRLLATDADLTSIDTAGYARFNSALDGIVERCDQRGVPLSGLYGMSEVLALFAWRGAPGASIEQRWRPAGRIVSPQADSRIVDDELQLRGPSLFAGYLADGGEHIDEALTGAAFDGPWFKTGDLARADGPRSFEFITRIGDVMRLGGFLVAPSEIEAALMNHPAVDQAQVVAIDRTSGARPVAFVIAASGCRVDQAEVIDHCRQHLAPFKCPVRVIEVDAFPVTDGPNGVKIQRGELRRIGAEILGP